MIFSPNALKHLGPLPGIAKGIISKHCRRWVLMAAQGECGPH